MFGNLGIKLSVGMVWFYARLVYIKNIFQFFWGRTDQRLYGDRIYTLRAFFPGRLDLDTFWTLEILRF
jgi:hypothetical protein